MKTLKELRTENSIFFKEAEPYLSWYVVYSTHRDAALINRANWTVFKNTFRLNKDTAILRFTHWACGWIDTLVVRPHTPAARKARELLAELEKYPVLDDEIFSQFEHDAAQEVWNTLDFEERVDLCRQARLSIFAARNENVPCDVIPFMDL